MQDQIVAFIHEQLQNNDLFKGGLLLMVGGAILAIVRSWPTRIWKLIKYHSMVVIDIPDNDPAFDWVNIWLSQHAYSKNKSRLLTVKTSRRGGVSYKLHTLLAPAPGTHYLWHKKRLMILSRNREQTSTANSMQADSFVEYFTIKLLGRDRKIALELIDEARKVATADQADKLITYRSAPYGEWKLGAIALKRKFDSVILPRDTSKALISDIQTFLDSEEWYLDRGIPYRRGYLFYGEPGNGKTSVINAIATHFNMGLGMVNLRADSDDESLIEAISNMPPNTIILLEDIDCATPSTDDTEKITFSGLLNALDGFNTPHGQIVMMTTNHYSKLDPALIRPGRCDVKQEFLNADVYQKAKMFKRFFPDSTEADKFADNFSKDVSMADLQQFMMTHRNNPQAALEQAENIS